MKPNRLNPLLTALLSASILAACTTAPSTPETAPAPGTAAGSRDDSNTGAASRPAPPKPRPPRSDKPAVKTDGKTDGKADGKIDRPDTRVGEIIVEEAPPETPIIGPAWLSQCINRQTEGGVVRCDADRLLAEPSPKIKVYTRDPSAAVRTRGGPVQLRSNLPRKYRFFVVP